MSTDFDKLRKIFLGAVERSAPAGWPAYLDEACAGDAELRRHAEMLLEAHLQGGSSIEPPHEDSGPPGSEGRHAGADRGAPGEEATGAYQPLAEAPGTVIGPYKLLQQIGEGGMGTVFMAEQTQPVQRKVALKIIKPGMDSRGVRWCSSQ